MTNLNIINRSGIDQICLAGAAAERISVLEQRADIARPVAERLARVEAHLEAIENQLDRIEARGQHAFVHDMDGSYVARYYRPERGDIILNPHDARCAYWNPFDDISAASDADRLASFIVAKPGGGPSGDDVWYDQARIVAAVVIRRLWEQGRGTVPELTQALRDMTADELAALARGTEASRVFQKDAEKATNSVLFCLAEASKIVGLLKSEAGEGATLGFDRFYQGLPGSAVSRPRSRFWDAGSTARWRRSSTGPHAMLRVPGSCWTSCPRCPAQADC